MNTDIKKSTTRRLPLIARIAIAMTFVNAWVIFEETIVDRHGLWRYMPYYRVGLFCVWDAAVFAITLLFLGVAPFRHRRGPTLSTAPLPLIAKVAIAMTFSYYIGHFFRLAWRAAANLLLISRASGNQLCIVSGLRCS
jgi:hypothetical protein